MQDGVDITLDQQGAVAVVRVANRPSGVLTAAGAKRLLELIQSRISDASTRAIIITGGQAEYFIRHYDLASIVNAAEALQSGQVEPAAFLAAPFAALTDLIAACDKPVIAAINGICMGGGLELALACDIRVAAHDVTHIGLPETRLDIFPGGGGMQRLARAIGTGRTMDMVLRGRTVNAARAYAMGIIHDLADDALAFSLEIAQDLASRDPAALTAAKQLVRTALAKPGAQGLADERLAFAELIRDNQPSLDRLRHVINAGTAVEAL